MSGTIRVIFNFWSVQLNGHIFLFVNSDMERLADAAIRKHGKDRWLLFKTSLYIGARMFDKSEHLAIERDAILAMQERIRNDPRQMPMLRYYGHDAREVAQIFLEACIAAPVCKGFLELEYIEIQGEEQWLLREYYRQSTMEKIRGKRRLFRTLAITPSQIESLYGYSMRFEITAAGEVYEISYEGVKIRPAQRKNHHN